MTTEQIDPALVERVSDAIEFATLDIGSAVRIDSLLDEELRSIAIAAITAVRADEGVEVERDWFDKGFIACWAAVTVEQDGEPFALSDQRLDAEWHKSADARAALSQEAEPSK